MVTMIKASRGMASIKANGTLTAEGKQVPAKCDHHNATQLLAPDQQHFLLRRAALEKVDWYRFGEDGAPVADGSFAMKNVQHRQWWNEFGLCDGFARLETHVLYGVQCPDNEPQE